MKKVSRLDLVVWGNRLHVALNVGKGTGSCDLRPFNVDKYDYDGEILRVSKSSGRICGVPVKGLEKPEPEMASLYDRYLSRERARSNGPRRRDLWKAFEVHSEAGSQGPRSAR